MIMPMGKGQSPFFSHPRVYPPYSSLGVQSLAQTPLPRANFSLTSLVPSGKTLWETASTFGTGVCKGIDFAWDYGPKILILGGAVYCYSLWRKMYTTGNEIQGLKEGLGKNGNEIKELKKKLEELKEGVESNGEGIAANGTSIGNLKAHVTQRTGALSEQIKIADSKLKDLILSVAASSNQFLIFKDVSEKNQCSLIDGQAVLQKQVKGIEGDISEMKPQVAQILKVVQSTHVTVAMAKAKENLMNNTGGHNSIGTFKGWPQVSFGKQVPSTSTVVVNDIPL